MGKYGKYVRHLLAVGVGWLGAQATEHLGVVLDDETQAALVVVGYAMAEKLLKRLGWLDPEGAADREAIKEEAALRP